MLNTFRNSLLHARNQNGLYFSALLTGHEMTPPGPIFKFSQTVRHRTDTAFPHSGRLFTLTAVRPRRTEKIEQ